jgi:hypothetical protein
VSNAKETNPLVERVDALIRRHRDATGQGEDDVPVLTDVVDPEAAAARPLDPEALAAEIERAVLARLSPQIEDAVRLAVREAVAAALAARTPKDAGS